MTEEQRLLKAKEMIRTTMTNFNVGGLVTLHSKVHTVWELVLPTWSLAHFTAAGELMMRHRGKSNLEDTSATYHLLLDCQRICKQMDKGMDALVGKLLEQGIEIDNKPFEER